MRKRKNETVLEMLRLSRALHACGAFDDNAARRIEHAGMLPPEPLTPEDFQAILGQPSCNVYSVARMLNTTDRRIRRWAQGLGKPKGAELRLLRMMRDRGVDAVFP
jgi:putative transcriptional regulator